MKKISVYLSKRYDSSLKKRLLIRLIAPLLIIIGMGAIDGLMMARHVGNHVYDRWLYDSAMTLASQIEVKTNGHEFYLYLPNTAVETLEWDTVDHIYGQIDSLNEGLVFGNGQFPPPPSNMVLKEPKYYNGVIDKQDVRIVAIMLQNPSDSEDVLYVQVAETGNKRQSLARDSIGFSMSLQLAFFLATCALVWMAVRSSLRVLDKIAVNLSKYKPDSPIPPIDDIEHIPSEIKPLIKSLNDLVARLADAQNSQRRFISNAAHQMRTPLATLQVQTERALRESDPKRHSDALTDVLGAVTRLRHVAHQLLVLARSERAGEQTLKMTEIDLAALARDELERWANAAIARNIDLGYEGPDNGIMILGETSLLRELISNLVDNAIRYGRAGGEVTLGLAANPTTLYVSDDGEGIPLHERSLVLERFYCSSDAVSKGCGLGLPIASEIAERHNAQLVICDNPNLAGCRIEVIFPAYKPKT